MNACPKLDIIPLKLKNCETLNFWLFANIDQFQLTSALHRYLRKVDCSSHISLQKIHFSKSANSGHIDKTKKAGQIIERSTKTRQASWVNVPALTANIFAAATNRTNILNKTGGTLH